MLAEPWQELKGKMPSWLHEALDVKRYDPVCNRVAPRVIEILSAWQDKHTGSNDIIPISWWQSTKYLLPASQRKGAATSFSNEDEQVLWVQRFLA